MNRPGDCCSRLMSDGLCAGGTDREPDNAAEDSVLGFGATNSLESLGPDLSVRQAKAGVTRRHPVTQEIGGWCLRVPLW